VIVTRRTLAEATGGEATSNAPVPLGPESMKATSKFCIIGPVFVLIVAVPSSTGIAGSRVAAVIPDCAENVMLVPVGICACQSNSLHVGSVAGGHRATKSCVKVAGGYPVMPTGGGGGAALSGDTQDVRSKNMNSSDFSCADSVPCRHDSGNLVALKGAHRP
jgi:hypothetical protein